MNRHRDEAGQSAIELLGLLPLLLLVALAVFQSLLIGHTAVATEQAARTAARVAMFEGDTSQVREAARQALPAWLRDDAVTRFPTGDRHRVEVTSRVPVLVPGLRTLRLEIARTVEMPRVATWD